MSNVRDFAAAGKSAAIATLERVAAQAERKGNLDRAAEFRRRAEFLRNPDTDEVLDALHADTPQGPDTDPEMVMAWTACDAVVDQGRGSMRAFWSKVDQGHIRSYDWGGVCYVRRIDVAREFGVWMDEKVREVA